MQQWLIAKDGDSEKVLAQYGWVRERRAAMFFRTEFEAQSYITSRRLDAHTTLAAVEDTASAPGTPNAAQTEYDPHGLIGRRHA